MPSPGRLFGRLLAVSLMAGAVLGILPPVFGEEGPPPTVLRVIPLDASRLLPGAARPDRAPSGTVLLREPAWTNPSTTCAPIRFTMAGFVWDQQGDSTVRARLSWGIQGDMKGPFPVLGDAEEGPDPGSPDDAGPAGTRPVWTGEARCVRYRLRLPAEEAVSGLRAVFVNTSGTATDPAPPTSADDLLARAWGLVSTPEPAEAAAVQPGIIPRSGWGAKEGMRRCGPDYADSLKMAYVHHTVNANGYGRARVDDLIRGIYAYHVQARKFCDIAYNFLIDRFGRIWEGRYGGIDQPVIGAHAMGFNTGSTGIAALGTFTSQPPSKKMVQAYKRLLAWRLDVAHIRPTGKAVMESAGGPNQKFDKGQEVTLPAIAGHRDTGFTTCPGARLYRKLPGIREAAEARGLPKIWNPIQAPASTTYGSVSVRYTAILSRDMSWTIDITDQFGAAVRHLAGQGAALDVTWDGKRDDGVTRAAPGTYTVTMRARAGASHAREAVFSLTIS
jgi:N-acetylmuramoyl-L-alanine amidase/FlgD Ig-like domain